MSEGDKRVSLDISAIANTPTQHRRIRQYRRKLDREHSILGFDAFFEEEDVRNLFRNFRNWLTQSGNTGINNFLLTSLIIAASALSFFLTSFTVLIPVIHGVGGYVLHAKEGWTFYQPGIGGVRFVALNGVSWAFYALSIVLHVASFATHDVLVHLTAFLTALLSMSFMFASLFAYQPPRELQGDATQTRIARYAVVEAKKDLKEYEKEFQMLALDPSAPEFNEVLQRSVIMVNSGDTPSGLWWVFVALQLTLALCTGWALFVARNAIAPIQILTLIVAQCCFLGVVPVTHAIGGKWKHIRTGYAAFQPGEGGWAFVTLQAFGWMMYSLSIVSSASALAAIAVGKSQIGGLLLGVNAIFGTLSELLVFSSLFTFLDPKADTFEARNPLFKEQPSHEPVSVQKAAEEEEPTWAENLLESLLKAMFDIANMLFGPGGDLDLNTRSPVLNGPQEYVKGEEKFQQAVSGIRASGEQYLVVGVGFVGKRLVKRLIERGEKKIRLFDVTPHNPFPGYPEVEYIRGDVTNIDSISKACEGVDVCYATFALIRFMDRLEHQVKLSYHVNVTGTQVLFDALIANNVGKVIITSSSHATTDERSMPRFNRTELAAYVTRETAHNHYGWTKALADQYALGMNGKELSNGDKLKVVVIRPCSGVFGGDDRTSFEKCVDLGVAPGIGSFCVMDWVYVENVVLGHLLAEEQIQQGNESVFGQAYNISNNDATTWLDFWHLVKKMCKMSEKPVRRKVKIEFCFVPMSLIWCVAYFSEFMQRVSKGRISLGKDVDSLTPAMLSTACMSYSYKSDKAKKDLGYEPAYSLDEGVQKSIYEYYTVHHLKKPLF